MSASTPSTGPGSAGKPASRQDIVAVLKADMEAIRQAAKSGSWLLHRESVRKLTLKISRLDLVTPYLTELAEFVPHPLLPMLAEGLDQAGQGDDRVGDVIERLQLIAMLLCNEPLGQKILSEAGHMLTDIWTQLANIMYVHAHNAEVRDLCGFALFVVRSSSYNEVLRPQLANSSKLLGSMLASSLSCEASTIRLEALKTLQALLDHTSHGMEEGLLHPPLHSVQRCWGHALMQACLDVHMSVRTRAVDLAMKHLALLKTSPLVVSMVAGIMERGGEFSTVFDSLVNSRSSIGKISTSPERIRSAVLLWGVCTSMLPIGKVLSKNGLLEPLLAMIKKATRDFKHSDEPVQLAIVESWACFCCEVLIDQAAKPERLTCGLILELWHRRLHLIEDQAVQSTWLHELRRCVARVGDRGSDYLLSLWRGPQGRRPAPRKGLAHLIQCMVEPKSVHEGSQQDGAPPRVCLLRAEGFRLLADVIDTEGGAPPQIQPLSGMDGESTRECCRKSLEVIVAAPTSFWLEQEADCESDAHKEVLRVWNAAASMWIAQAEQDAPTTAPAGGNALLSFFSLLEKAGASLPCRVELLNYTLSFQRQGRILDALSAPCSAERIRQLSPVAAEFSQASAGGTVTARHALVGSNVDLFVSNAELWGDEELCEGVSACLDQEVTTQAWNMLMDSFGRTTASWPLPSIKNSCASSNKLAQRSTHVGLSILAMKLLDRPFQSDLQSCPAGTINVERWVGLFEWLCMGLHHLPEPSLEEALLVSVLKSFDKVIKMELEWPRSACEASRKWKRCETAEQSLNLISAGLVAVVSAAQVDSSLVPACARLLTSALALAPPEASRRNLDEEVARFLQQLVSGGARSSTKFNSELLLDLNGLFCRIVDLDGAFSLKKTLLATWKATFGQSSGLECSDEWAMRLKALFEMEGLAPPEPLGPLCTVATMPSAPGSFCRGREARVSASPPCALSAPGESIPSLAPCSGASGEAYLRVASTPASASRRRKRSRTSSLLGCTTYTSADGSQAMEFDPLLDSQSQDDFGSNQKA